MKFYHVLLTNFTKNLHFKPQMFYSVLNRLLRNLCAKELILEIYGRLPNKNLQEICWHLAVKYFSRNLNLSYFRGLFRTLSNIDDEAFLRKQLKGPGAKNSSLFLRPNFNDFMEKESLFLFLWHNFNGFLEKEPCRKFCGVLINSHEIMELQSFEFGVSDVILSNVQNISSLFFFACDALRDQKPFVQHKKREKHPWKIVACNFTKSNFPPWVFFTFFILCKWFLIAQRITYFCSFYGKRTIYTVLWLF